MKTILRLAMLACTLVSLASCQKDVADQNSSKAPSTTAVTDKPETAPAIQTTVNTSVSARIKGFYQSIPARYDSGAKKYPLLVFLHGVGELGNGVSDLSRLAWTPLVNMISNKTFPAKFTVNGADYSFIVVNPQFTEWPQPTDVNAMIDYAIAHYRVDQTRIYVAGLSMGGGATWDYAGSYASRVAAIVPICGAAWPNDQQFKTIASANLPVWAFHNNDDGTVAVGTTIGNVDKLNSFSPSVKAQKTIWATGGHDAWSKATNPDTRECNGKNIYEWMLQYHR